MTVAVATHYEVTHAGLTARISRHPEIPKPSYQIGWRDQPACLTVDGIDGVWVLEAEDKTVRSVDGNGRVNITATFLIGDDFDDALRRAAGYATAMCQVVADHRAAVARRNEVNREKVELARQRFGAA